MKYIKNFENINCDNIKKYLVIKSNNDFYILEVLNIFKNDNNIEVKKIFKYEGEVVFDYSDVDLQSFKLRFTNRNIVYEYTSNDINSCKEYINLKYQANKYNL